MNRVKEFRSKRGLTQKQLGAAIGKYQVWIYQLEYGYRIPGDLDRKKLSEVLGVTGEELFPPEGPEAGQPEAEVEIGGFAAPT